MCVLTRIEPAALVYQYDALTELPGQGHISHILQLDYRLKDILELMFKKNKLTYVSSIMSQLENC